VIVGQDRAVEQFSTAWASRKLHHAWLLAGPRGVGKASFAHAAARRVLAEAAGPAFELPGIDTADSHPIVKLVEAGSHPDMRQLARLTNEKTGNLNRSIKVEQIRELGEFMGMTAGLSPWRVVVIDSVDDPDAARFLRSDQAKGEIDLLVIALGTAADPVALFIVAGAGSRPPFSQGENERSVREALVDPEGVDRADRFDSEAAGAALIGQRAVDEAVAQYPAAAFQSRANRFLHVVRPGGGEEQSFSPRPPSFLGSGQ
jgi:DNA polymerase III delta prime subunit